MYHSPNSGLDLPCHSLLFNNKKKEHDQSYMDLKNKIEMGLSQILGNNNCRHFSKNKS